MLRSAIRPSPLDLNDQIGTVTGGPDTEEENSKILKTWVLNSRRHLQKIEGAKLPVPQWRMKERMKTVSVALVLCLNIGVDPPDVHKINPCARLECWIDPLSMASQKALETIGNTLQQQYERWQPRARYKQSLDPTADDIKKLCTSLRRNAKEERVLFHYNGHGVPKPTSNSEIWVFNKKYTQYIPLAIYDLQNWMGYPSIYVYDCSNAAIIIQSYKKLMDQREQEGCASKSKNCIQLASCGADQILPMNPDLPADLFTACLTTPIKIALKWYVLQNGNKLVPNITMKLIDSIPGQLNDRRTMLGELNWVFTAITDTIAWNTLPRELFQKLFRQDLLVASLLRNFLLADRVMRCYNCTPVLSPRIPATFQHPMWQAWDLALDLSLSQLVGKNVTPAFSFRTSTFFAEQLTAFQVWLQFGEKYRPPPEQLPIVLQVLLSQVHRLRALDLLSRFLDLGDWAVRMALSVGIFPYVLRLLQSSARELRPLLIAIWSKILAVDNTCQVDLVKDSCHRYFLNVLTDTQTMQPLHRTQAVFILTMIVNNYRVGQEATLKSNLIAICLEQLDNEYAMLRQWLCLCLGKVWQGFDAARWCGVRDSAPDKLYKLLKDSVPEVRASAVFALSTFAANRTNDVSSTTSTVSTSASSTATTETASKADSASSSKANSASSSKSCPALAPPPPAQAQRQGGDHATTVNQGVMMTLVGCVGDGSPLVRRELIVAFASSVGQSEGQFVMAAVRLQDHEKFRARTTAEAMHACMRRNTKESLTSSSSKRSPLIGQAAMGHVSTVISQVWRSLMQLAFDSCPKVAALALIVTSHVNSRVKEQLFEQITIPIINNSSDRSDSPPSNITMMKSRRANKISISEDIEGVTTLVTTELFQWSCRQFFEFTPNLCDPNSGLQLNNNYRMNKALHIRKQCLTEYIAPDELRLDDHVFTSRNDKVPQVICMHPYDYQLAVADKFSVTFWNWRETNKMSSFRNHSTISTTISSLNYINTEADSLLMVGTDDGAIRFWRNYSQDYKRPPQLSATWQAMVPEHANHPYKGKGMLTDWQQDASLLHVGGDCRFINIWDVCKELKIAEVSTSTTSLLTSLNSRRNKVVAGFADGTVKMFDTRCPSEQSIALHKHKIRIVKVHIFENNNRIMTSGADGEIRYTDIRTGTPLSSFTCPVKQVGENTLTDIDVHEKAGLIACATGQSISIFNENEDCISCIKYHVGFIGQRTANLNCISFHPFKVRLACGRKDSEISVYSVKHK